jgi:NHL repeat-containing protein
MSTRNRKLMFNWFSSFMILLLVGVLLPTSSASAQNQQPPRRTTNPFISPHYQPARNLKDYESTGSGVIPFASAGIKQNALQVDVTLGQPGLSFRYAQTFGTTGEPYLADTTHLNRPIGLFMDGSNNLYVTEDLGDRVLKYDSGGNNLLALGQAAVGCYAENYIFCLPQDTALDGSGDFWVADGNRVVEYDLSGVFIQQFPATDPWMSGDDNAHFNRVNGIAFDHLGRMYVSDTNNQRVQVYTFSGSVPVYHSTIGVTGASGSDNSHFNNPYRLAVDSSNRVYVTDLNNNRVQRCTFSGGWTCVTFHGGLNGPQGITIDGSNNVFIADTWNGNIVKCSSVAVCANLVSGTYSFTDLAVDSTGNIYGAATYAGIVVKYNSSGGLVGTFLGTEFVPYLTDGHHYFQPRVAIDGQDNVIIVEEQAQRLTKLNSNGTFLWSVGVPGVDAFDNTHLNYPHGVAVDSGGNIYVADNNRVQIFNSSGTYQYTIGGSWGSGNYQFQWASGIAVDNNGTIYVSDCPNNRVQVYNSSRTYVATIGVTGVTGSDNSHLICPNGVGVDAARNIYVSDAGNNRVQKFNSSRIWQMTLGTPGPGGSGSADFAHFGGGTEDIAVDAQGRIYVADGNNNRVQVFDSSGAYLTTIGGSWGANSSQFRYTSGVDVDSQGNVYISDFNNARIQKFAPGVPGWVQKNINGFGVKNNYDVESLEVFNGQLYAGASNGIEGTTIWRNSNGNIWTAVTSPGFGVATPATNSVVFDMIEFNGYLYAGTGWWLDDGVPGQIWRSSNGTTWEMVGGGGFGNGNNLGIVNFAVFNNVLYASTFNTTDGFDVWRSATGNSGDWHNVANAGFGGGPNYKDITSLTVFNGYLYAAVEASGSASAQVWRTNDGTTWNQVNVNGFGDSNNFQTGGFAVFGGYLYIGTRNDVTGAQMYRSNNGTTWIPVISAGFGDINNYKIESLYSFGGNLYAGTDNGVTGIEIWRSIDGTTWSQINPDGFGDSNNVGTLWSNATTAFNNGFYIGVANNANGGEIWRSPSVAMDTTGVFRPSNGLLYLKNSNTTGFADVAINYGLGGDYPVTGDWDGNGTATIGIYRNGSFYLRNSNTLGFADLVFAFGQPGDQPIAGDWDGNGTDTIGVYRTSTGQFLLRNSNASGAADMSFYLGNVGDVGIAGDWNKDGKDTTGVFRPSNGVIFLKNTNSTGFADVALNYGLPGDQPITGDWNNDGIDTIGVYRNGQFLLRNSNTVGFADISFYLGNPGDMPIAGDWDALP